MARLKGGKLLLDLTNGDVNLTDEEINCILTKGLQVKLSILGLGISIDVLFTDFITNEEDDLVSLKYHFYQNGDEIGYVLLNLVDKIIQFLEI